MRLRLTAVFVCLLAGSAGAFERKTEEINGAEAVAREVIVKFRPGRAAAARQLDATADAEHSEAVGGGNDLRLIRSRSKDVATLVKELSARPDVELAEPNYILRHAATPNDPSFPSMWSLANTGAQYGGVAGADIDARSAWDITTGSPSVAVGIIDTGVDLYHPDLQANLWSAPSQFTVSVGGRSVTCPAGSRGFDAFTFTCYPRDDHSHGTHIAGTIGATGNNAAGVTGINWRTKMVAVRTMNAANTGTAVEAINGIDFLIQANAHFAKTPTPLNVRVMSASWFIGGPSYTLYMALQRAQAADILFVAAAGNSNVNTDVYKVYPAGYDLPNIISVAATDMSDNKAFFSSYGAASVDLGAPGMYIMSTMPGGGYGLKHGTSMATPHVTATAALVLSRCQLSTAQLKDTILRNVDLVPGLAGLTLTGGRLNAYKAVRSCAGPTASFSIGATPSSRSLAPGQSTSYSLALAPQNGFTGSVALSVSGVPAGTTANFSNSSVYLSSAAYPTLNVAVGGSTAPGTYTLVANATGNGITKQAQLTLTVTAAGTFTLGSTGAVAVVAGQSATYKQSMTSQNGLVAILTMSVRGLPAGAAGSFSPNPLWISTSAASTLSVTTSSSTPAGTYYLTITAAGTNGTTGAPVSKTVTVPLTVSAPVVAAPAPAPTNNLPAAPVSTQVVRMYSIQTQFSWTPGSSNQTGFQVEACQGAGCNFSTKLSGNFPGSSTSMTHNPVYAGQVWSYRVRAVNSYGVSAWSPVATILIQ